MSAFKLADVVYRSEQVFSKYYSFDFHLSLQELENVAGSKFSGLRLGSLYLNVKIYTILDFFKVFTKNLIFPQRMIFFSNSQYNFFSAKNNIKD